MKGPSRKEEAQPKIGNRNDHEVKVSKSKRQITNSLGNKQVPTTFDEAKASCKARKRKERQESFSSLCQERKVIRSNSEERPNQKMYIENKNGMRRVSSSEDFKKSTSVEKTSTSPNRQDANEKNLTYEDYEYEKRRSHERFSRPLTLKSKRNHPNKRLKARYVSRAKFKPDNTFDAGKDNVKKAPTAQSLSTSDICPHGVSNNFEDTENIELKLANFLQLHGTETERSPSPDNTPSSPVLDLTTLLEQVDSSEPLLSCPSRDINEDTETLPSLSVATNHLLSSPRNSIIATHRIYLDPDIAQANLVEKLQNPVDERLQKLTKQINSVKKKIRKHESEFEAKHGYKPSHFDKLNDRSIKKLYGDLGKLRKEQKQLTEVSANCLLISETKRESPSDVATSLQETVSEIEKRLTSKRELSKRTYIIDDMTREQLLEEKVAIQKALLYLESLHGRPNSKDDRDLVRPFYDRYRTLKRMVAKGSTNGASGNELATIHENETMNFITPIPSQSLESESDKNTLPSNSTDSDTDSSSIGENLHSLSRTELLEQFKNVTEEKKELRRTIKEYEAEIQIRTGRMIQKEDKGPMESVYTSYKKCKAKLKLVEALIGKQV